METVIQNPDLGVRKAGWKKRKLLGTVGGKKRAQRGKKRTYSHTETVIQNPSLGCKAAPSRFKEADLHPQSRGENGGLEYRGGGKLRTQGGKKRGLQLKMHEI